jgi:hypothetical protein
VCGHQKLVYTGDLKRLLANKDRLFSGAQVTATRKTADTNHTRAEALLEILARPGLPETITTKWISQQMGVPWRNVGKHVMHVPTVQRAIAALGWTYEGHKGRGGSTFVRQRSTTLSFLKRGLKASTSLMAPNLNKVPARKIGIGGLEMGLGGLSVS